ESSVGTAGPSGIESSDTRSSSARSVSKISSRSSLSGRSEPRATACPSELPRRRPPDMAAHVMVDLETCGTQLNSAVLSIGAVVFDAENIGSYKDESGAEVTCESFYRTIRSEEHTSE